MDFIPERSELQVENIEVKDPVVKQMIKDLGLRKLVPGLNRKKGGEQWKRCYKRGSQQVHAASIVIVYTLKLNIHK